MTGKEKEKDYSRMKPLTKWLFGALFVLSATFNISTVDVMAEPKGTPLQGSIGKLHIEGDYYLADDVIGDIVIDKDKSVTLDLNGHVLTGLGKKSVVSVYGSFILRDTSDAGTGKITGGCVELDSLNQAAAAGGGVCVYEGCSFVMEGGTIADNYGIAGGGVDVGKGGSFTMKGGTIRDNTATGAGEGTANGGGVNIAEAKFVMEGGLILNNSADYGGGILLVSDSNGANKASFDFKGGYIKDNKANYGGGLFIWNSTVNMYDGEILSNEAYISGGGVGVYRIRSEYNLIGGLISENYAPSGGGVSVGLFNEGAFFFMQGGSISNNTAKNGSGVYCLSKGSVAVTGGGIVANHVSDCGGVYMDGKLTLGGAAYIMGNDSPAGENQNLLMVNAKSFSFGTSTDGKDGNGVLKPMDAMTVGIATSNTVSKDKWVVISESSGIDYSKCFVPDKTETSVIYYTTGMNGGKGYYNPNTLYLGKRGISIGKHFDNATAALDPVYASPDSKRQLFDISAYGVADGTALKVEWKSVNSGVTTWSQTAPVEGLELTSDGRVSTKTSTPAGDYRFRITNGEKETESGSPNPKFVCSSEAVLSVSPRIVTVSGIKAENKSFDGRKDAVLDYSQVVIEGLATGDSLNVSAKGTFEDANAGTGKKVSIKSIKLEDINGSGISTDYVLSDTGNQTETVADITKCEISVSIVPNGGVYGDNIKGAAVTLNNLPAGENLSPVVTYSKEDYNSESVPQKAGKYTVTVSLPVTAVNYVLKGTLTSEFTVEKKSVELPDAGCLVYTGRLLKSDIKSTDLYTVVKNDGGINAGEYEVVLTLKDPDNCKWANNENKNSISVPFTIAKAENSWTVEPSIRDITYGSSIVTSGKAKNGEVAISYTGIGVTAYEGTSKPTKAGKYKAVFTVVATDNYDIMTKDVIFTIHPKQLIISNPSVEASKSYDATTDCRVISSGKLNNIVDGDDVFVLTKAEYSDSKVGNDKKVTVSYSLYGADADNYLAPVDYTGATASIMRAKGVISVDTSDITAFYGDKITLPAATSNVGAEVVTDTDSFDFTKVGTYEVTYTLSETAEYTGDTKTVKVIVNKKILAKPVADRTEFVYNGKSQTYKIESNKFYTISGNVRKNAGTYEVTVSLKDKNNYVWSDKSDDDLKYKFEIVKAKGIIKVDTTDIYVNCNEKVQLPKATSEFGKVLCDTQSSQLVNPGTYKVVYSLPGTDNYTGATETITVVIKDSGSKPVASPDGGNEKGEMGTPEPLASPTPETKKRISGSAENGEASDSPKKTTESVNTPAPVSASPAITLETAPSLAPVETEKPKATPVMNTPKPEEKESLPPVETEASTLSGGYEEGEEKPAVLIEIEGDYDHDVVLDAQVVWNSEGRLSSDHKPIVPYRRLIKRGEKVAAVYDVNLILRDMNIQPGELGDNVVVTARFRLPECLEGGDFRLLHVHSEDDVQTISKDTDASVGGYYIDEEGYLVTRLDRFSEFVFIYKPICIMHWPFVCVLVVFLISFLAFTILKRDVLVFVVCGICGAAVVALAFFGGCTVCTIFTIIDTVCISSGTMYTVMKKYSSDDDDTNHENHMMNYNH